MRMHVSIAISMTALIVAVFGSTPVGEAAWNQVLPKNSVGTKQLKRNAVKPSKLAPNAVRSGHVLNGSLLAADFKSGQLPQGPQGPKGDPGTPATRLWAYVSATGTLRGGGGVVASSRQSTGTFNVTFNQSIANCAATASYLRQSGDPALNVENHFVIIRPSTTQLQIFIANPVLNGAVNIPFGLIVVC
jgi:hypothetical protein